MVSSSCLMLFFFEDYEQSGTGRRKSLAYSSSWKAIAFLIHANHSLACELSAVSTSVHYCAAEGSTLAACSQFLQPDSRVDAELRDWLWQKLSACNSD
jgi:hypothetical protein